MNGTTVEFRIQLRTGRHGRKRMREGARPDPPRIEPGRVPRLSRLMALALRYDRLIREGHVRDYADLARLGGVTRARISQIMDLLNLDPRIQESILLLPRSAPGRDAIPERLLRPIVMEPDFEGQRRLWNALLAERIPESQAPIHPVEA